MAQTYKNIEVVVINDGSNDNGATEAIAKSYGNKIRYFSKPNGGVSTALNLGIKKMRGEYFSWLSHDDLYYPNKVERQMSEICKFVRGSVIIASNVEVLFENGLRSKTKIHESTFKHLGIFLATSSRVGLNGCSLLIPKEALAKEGFDPRKKFTQDYDLWFRLKDNYKFYLIKDCLVVSRRHGNQDSADKANELKTEADILHSSMLDKISKSEYDNYFNEIGIRDCLKNLKAYLRNGYVMTSSTLLNVLLEYLYSRRGIGFYKLFSKVRSSCFVSKKDYGKLKNNGELSQIIDGFVRKNDKTNRLITNPTQRLYNSIIDDGWVFIIKRFINKIIS